MKTRHADEARTRLIRLVHTGCRVLGIDEDERRNIQFDISGHESLTRMSVNDMKRVLHELRRRGFIPVRKTVSKNNRWRVFSDWLPPVPETGKLKAMWLALWNLGCTTDPSVDALHAWVRKQTGLSAAQWVSRAQISSCIEALKSWLARPVTDGGGGVEWNDVSGKLVDPRLAVYSAQIRKLGIGGMQNLFHELAFSNLSDAEKDTHIADVGAQIRSLRDTRH